MKITSIILIVTIVSLSGCEPMAGIMEPAKEKVVLTVDFQQGKTLRYKFLTGRDITIALGSTENPSQARKTTDKSSESLEIIMAYKPIEIDPFGFSKIEAKCESVKVTRSRRSQRDAVENLGGETFTLTVGPTGKIEDYSSLDALLKEIGEKAFQADTSRGRIKNPDMISDFVATQWFLWDSIAGIEEPSDGIAIGQTWKSKLSIPTPMVMRKAREVTYKLDEIRESETGRLAVITGTYQPADSVPQSWPIPYSGKFQMTGPFGFYRNYRIQSLKGSGEELFNIDSGLTEQYNQQYTIEMKASLLLPLAGAEPRITIDQTITMTLLKD